MSDKVAQRLSGKTRVYDVLGIVVGGRSQIEKGSQDQGMGRARWIHETGLSEAGTRPENK
jgi:hypothetical protein